MKKWLKEAAETLAFGLLLAAFFVALFLGMVSEDTSNLPTETSWQQQCNN